MIKLIATDLDGTLLNENHVISEVNFRAVRRAQESGIRFMIATGRNYKDAQKCLEGHRLSCDYIVASGAEIRNENSKVLRQVPMDAECFRAVLECTDQYGVAVCFCSDIRDYMIGTDAEIIAYLCMNARLFTCREDMDDEAIMGTEIFRRQYEKVQSVDCVERLMKQQIPIYKIFISDSRVDKLQRLNQELVKIPGIVSASSFRHNIELTHCGAQKGIALKDYSEMLGFSMDEVMAFGDSMNDYSMLSMDFGATVAMENAMEEIKAVSKYRTLANVENGVAYAIDKLLAGNLEELRQ